MGVKAGEQNRNVFFVDTTLRDGAQSPGVFFDRPAKIALVTALSSLGVKEIEVGAPCVGALEEEDIAALVGLSLPVTLFTWNRAVKEDLYASLRLGIRKIHLSLPVSDSHIGSVLRKTRGWVRDRMVALVALARQEGVAVQVGFEDASRADLSFLLDLGGEARQAGAERLRFCDTVGTMNYGSVLARIGQLSSLGLPLEIHCHNDLGMATANTLAGFQGGARYLSTTVSGVGERAGNASMEEVAFALEFSLAQETGLDLPRLSSLGRWMHQVLGRTLSPYRPVLGSRVFHHASGIHVDGVLKSSENYEPFPPELAGQKRRLLVTHMTGRAGIRHALEHLGFAPDPEQLDRIVPLVRREGIRRRGIVPPHVILGIFLESRDGMPDLALHGNGEKG